MNSRSALTTALIIAMLALLIAAFFATGTTR